MKHLIEAKDIDHENLSNEVSSILYYLAKQEHKNPAIFLILMNTFIHFFLHSIETEDEYIALCESAEESFKLAKNNYAQYKYKES